MPRLTASDRSSLIKLASSLEKGSEERKAILSGLKRVSGRDAQWSTYGVEEHRRVKIRVLKDVRDPYGDRPIIFKKGEIIDGEVSQDGGLIKIWPHGIAEIVGVNDKTQKGRWEIL